MKPETLKAYIAIAFGLSGGILTLWQLGPLAATGIILLFMAWAMQREVRDHDLLHSFRQLMAGFRAERGELIHVLHGGLPLCGFTTKVPADWPADMRWMSIEEFDPDYPGTDVCGACRRVVSVAREQSEQASIGERRER